MKQLGAVYDPVFDVCLPTNVHRGMAGAIAIPAADAILFLLMLVGLLLRAHGNKVGIWRVLYNQVIFEFLPLLFAAGG